MKIGIKDVIHLGSADYIIIKNCCSLNDNIYDTNKHSWRKNEAAED